MTNALPDRLKEIASPTTLHHRTKPLPVPSVTINLVHPLISIPVHFISYSMTETSIYLLINQRPATGTPQRKTKADRKVQGIRSIVMFQFVDFRRDRSELQNSLELLIICNASGGLWGQGERDYLRRWWGVV